MNNNESSVPNLRRKKMPLHRLITAASGSGESRDEQRADEFGGFAPRPFTLESFRESLLGNRE
jgi:hypothetical protein